MVLFMNHKEQQKPDLMLLFHCFMVFAVIGWIYEVIVSIVNDGVFVNRGFLFGPYLPVYGFGGIISLLLLYKLKEKKILIGKLNITPIIIFLLIILIATITELVTSYLLEFITSGNGFLWDYSNGRYGPDFQGRIALLSCLRFGLLGIFGIYICYPLITLINNKLRSSKKGYLALKIGTGVLLIIILSDTVVSASMALS